LAGGDGVAASVQERLQSPSNVVEEKMRRRRRRRRRRRASPSVGTSGEQVDGGGDVVPLFFGLAEKRRRQRSRGRRRWRGVKKRSLPPPSYLYIAG
jgi:hypothetical protein